MGTGLASWSPLFPKLEADMKNHLRGGGIPGGRTERAPNVGNLQVGVAAVDGALWARPPGSASDPVLALVANERGLSSREMDVLAATCRGHTTKEIAVRLGLSPKTVEYYWARTFKKLGCRSKVDAMAILYRRACEVGTERSRSYGTPSRVDPARE
jgi:DNA-binding CsgD family transcriptional regulator